MAKFGFWVRFQWAVLFRTWWNFHITQVELDEDRFFSENQINPYVCYDTILACNRQTQSIYHVMACYVSSTWSFAVLSDNVMCRCALWQLQGLLRRVPEMSSCQRGWATSTTQEPAVQPADIQQRQRLDHCKTLLFGYPFKPRKSEAFSEATSI